MPLWSQLVSSIFATAIGLTQRAIGHTRVGSRIAIKIKNQCDMVIGARLSTHSGMFSSGEDWLAALVAPSSRFFVDVGANVGQWTLTFARHMSTTPRGLLFEPNPATAARVRAALVDAKFDNCEVVEAAASDVPGSALFFAEAGYGETSSLYSANLRTTARTVSVKVSRLDDELSSRNISAVDVLKIDAEGHDFFVMLGAESYIASRRIGLMQFEYNSPWIDAGATLTRAYDFLESYGYRIRLLRGNGLYELNVRKTGEFFKYSNFIAYCTGHIGDILDKLPCGPAI